MKRLGRARADELVAEMEEAANPENWETWYKQHYMDAIVEFPLSELMNPNIAGFVWAWKMQGKIKVDKIEKQDRFNAQGLESKVITHTTLLTALLVYRELPPHRCQIFLL